MWFITTDIDHCIKTGGLGGLGHMFYLYITSYMIGLIYNIEHVYFPFKTAGTAKHQNASSAEKLDWDNFINFKQDEKHHLELKCKRIYLPFLQPFQSYTLVQLNNFFNKYNRKEDILFLIGNCNRILPGEFYKWCTNNLINTDLYNQLVRLLRYKCVYKTNIKKGLLVIQIRRGDVVREPFEYYKDLLNFVSIHNDIKKIVIISLGTNEQMLEIQRFFTEYKNIEYLLNHDTINSFKLMMDAEFLIGGESSFPKIAGLYSDNHKYVLPLSPLNCKEIPLENTWHIMQKNYK